MIMASMMMMMMMKINNDDDDDNDDDTFDQKWRQHFLGEEQQPRCPPRAKALK